MIITIITISIIINVILLSAKIKCSKCGHSSRITGVKTK